MGKKRILRSTRRGVAGNKRTRRHSFRITCHPEPVVSVIVPVMNEHRTLPAVIREAAQAHVKTEVIVVANGCRDGSAKLARGLGARVLEYAEPLGHDVPRAVGAKAAKGEVLLFVDGDMVVRASELRPFVREILQGGDVALNDYSGPVESTRIHPVVSAKYMLNTLIGRPDLGGASLTAVPHALSRQALQQLGAGALAHPPMAYTSALLGGLNVRPVHFIDVGRRNRIRRRRGEHDLLTPLIAGDHMEAISRILEQRGPRCGFSDLGRLREKAR
jgi:glycosyltransferase involved in cell wall biosynthesis